MSGGLTIKQDRFAREYVKDGNGTRAAITAGYAKPAAHVMASENLRKPKVSEAIKILRRRQAERLDISREKIVNDIAHIAEQSAVAEKYGEALKANELILKAQGYLVERQLNLSVDVTQSHLDALQSYTDKRVAEAKQEIRAELRADVERHSHPFADVDAEPTQHNVNDRVTDVMESDTDVDATDAGNTR